MKVYILLNHWIMIMTLSTDLIVAKENGLEILFGDSVYSYTKRSEFITQFTSPQFIIADLYKDSNFDLVNINKLEDQLIIYSNMVNTTDPINIEFNGLSYISILKKKNSNSLVVLSKKGKILILKFN